jgi:hypothetical protein
VRGPARARSVLTAALVFALVAQVGLAVALVLGPVRLRDPEYAHKLALVRARQAEFPESPLVLALGSSRTAMALRPEFLRPARPGDPLLFNFGVKGAGPARMLLDLRRLLADGVRPRAVLVEVWPGVCDAEQADRIAPGRLTAAEAAFVTRFAADPVNYASRWLGSSLLPWSGHRRQLIAQVPVPRLPGVRRPHPRRPTDRWGWLRPHEPADPSAYRPAAEALSQATFGPALAGDAPASPSADRALGEFLALCRGEGIAVVLVMLPESGASRNWYSPGGLARLGDYAMTLARDAGAGLIDARDWLPDDAFADAVHLGRAGAARLTERLAAHPAFPRGTPPPGGRR